MKTKKRMKKSVERSLVLIVLLVTTILSGLLCHFLIWRFRFIVLDIPKPPGTQVTVTYKRNALYLVWEEQALIPEDTFESPEEVQQYYTTELAKLGWFPFGEDDIGYFDYMPTACNKSVTELTDEQRRQYSLQLYSEEGGPGGPPELMCLYIKDSASNGFYTVRLLSLRPTLFEEFNT